MLTFNKHSEYFNLLLEISNGLVYIKFGCHIFINLYLVTDPMVLEFKGHDQCFKGY
jgi:hypothetical protein